MYLCRIFDSLNRGSNYSDIKPAHHIGILDFVLFPDNPVFNETFLLYGNKTQQIYTNKFTLYAVCLPNVEMATEKDKSSHLTEWAAMFKAKKWEELRMLAQKNPDIDQAITSMYMLSEDFNIREQMIRREEYLANEKYKKETIEK